MLYHGGCWSICIILMMGHHAALFGRICSFRLLTSSCHQMGFWNLIEPAQSQEAYT